MNNKSRYIIGIDLGTTNSSLTFIDTNQPKDKRCVEIMLIPQIVALGEIDSLTTLPSFIYLPESQEINCQQIKMPWQDTPPDYVVGTYARDMGTQTPHKVISSAKSWLCCESIDRLEEILPFQRESLSRKISPVQATTLYLKHLRDAWNYQIAKNDPNLCLENQELYLTVPASFDAVARELTVTAAKCANLNVKLLEEPQAAFYAWLYNQGENWRQTVKVGDVILVCDIGGGTTDFSLITVTDHEGNMQLERIAVGNHILLGGDNMDLTIAYTLAQQLQQEKNITLDSYQMAALTHACRTAKEKLGENCQLTEEKVTILGRGTSLIANTITIPLTSEQMEQSLLNGFFPTCQIDAQPTNKPKIGIRTLGLEYASDPAITHHLAKFLSNHCPQTQENTTIIPTAILFNGGVTKSQPICNTIANTIQSWNQNQTPVSILSSNNLELAVSIGATWYGNICRTGTLRIKSGSPRSYYLGIESSQPAVPGFAPPIEALCVASFGLEEGTHLQIPLQGVGIVVGEPTEFRFFSSTHHPEHQVGDLLPYQNGTQITELAPLVINLPANEKQEEGNRRIGTLIPVTLECVLTEVGTLQIWGHAIQGSGKWKLEYELRATTESN